MCGQSKFLKSSAQGLKPGRNNRYSLPFQYCDARKFASHEAFTGSMNRVQGTTGNQYHTLLGHETPRHSLLFGDQRSKWITVVFVYKLANSVFRQSLPSSAGKVRPKSPRHGVKQTLHDGRSEWTGDRWRCGHLIYYLDCFILVDHLPSAPSELYVEREDRRLHPRHRNLCDVTCLRNLVQPFTVYKTR